MGVIVKVTFSTSDIGCLAVDVKLIKVYSDVYIKITVKVMFHYVNISKYYGNAMTLGCW